jgi:hypothetical protein
MKLKDHTLFFPNKCERFHIPLTNFNRFNF